MNTNSKESATQVDDYEMPMPCADCGRVLDGSCGDNCCDQELPLNQGLLTRIHTSANMPYEDIDDEMEDADVVTISVPETIFIPASPLLVREHTEYGPERDRKGDEKYFRQAIQIFNKSGKLVDSGFVQINDYTKNCEMVKVCNKYKTYLHAFERWEHHGSKFFKTDKLNITDLKSGNIVKVGVPSYIGQCKTFCELTDGGRYSFDNLDRDRYSEILLECLEEINSANTPQHLRELRKKIAFENPNLIMSEKGKIVKDGLRAKALTEIEDVFAIKNLEQYQEQEQDQGQDLQIRINIR